MENSPFNLDYQNSSTESKIIAAFERISQAFRVLLWNECTKHGLSPIQVQVLIFVLYQNRSKSRVSYLASEFNMTKATMSDTVKALGLKGLIEKEVDPNDSRSYSISLTTKGRKIAEETSLFSGEILIAINKLYPEDKENLLLSLISIIHHLYKTDIIAIQRMCLTCVHFIKGDTDHAHFCKLLNVELQPKELRVDCPEHELKEN